MAPTFSAALPQIPSVFTGAGSFIEGDIEVLGQDNRSCPSQKYPIKWIITGPGAQKMSEGEQEHCNDFQYAFDISSPAVSTLMPSTQWLRANACFQMTKLSTHT